MIEEFFGKAFKRRSFILGMGKSFLFTGLVARLVHLQIFNREHYQVLADKNRILDRMIAPPRGQIIGDKGKVLAINQNIYRCLVSSDADGDIHATVDLLRSILNLSESSAEEIYKQLLKKNSVASLVKENLTWEEMAALQIRNIELPGLMIEKVQDRKYLHPQALCHVVGYVSQASEKDLAEYNLEAIPGLKIGKNGLEKTFQSLLEGTPGKQRVEVNAKRRIVRVLDNMLPKSGTDLHTTINLDLQLKIAKILEEHKRAAAVVMDVHTGAVKALVSHPGYDTNLFVPGIQKKDWQHLLNHEDHPLINKVTSAQYAPGSTFKMIVALAALKEGVINSKTEFYCPGHYDLGSHRFHCWTWKLGGHGTVNLESAIARSCDTYFYHVALQIGALKMVEMAQKFLLGQATGIELKSEKKGLLPTPEWAKFRKGFFTQKGNAFNISIGQGVVLSTPLQLARMTAMLANKGKIVRPHLVEPQNAEPEKFIDGIEPEWYELMQAGMMGCVNQPGGTAYGARPTSDWVIAGKTGSSQVSRITMQQRQDGTYKDLPYQLRDHAFFVGFAPYDSPKYAVSILIEHGQSGGRVAAPVGVQALLATKECCG
jgi:penicillin-binding protein 2